jgi:hypothetical protein
MVYKKTALQHITNPADAGNIKQEKFMRFIEKYLTAICAALSVAFFIIGIAQGHHNMIMSYAIVVCLSCIGIG